MDSSRNIKLFSNFTLSDFSLQTMYTLWHHRAPEFHCDKTLQESIMEESGFPGGSVGKESTWNIGDPDSSPGLRKSLGEGNGNPLQYSCLGNPTDRGAWQATAYGIIRVGNDLATRPPLPRCLIIHSIGNAWQGSKHFLGRSPRSFLVDAIAHDFLRL